MSEQKLTREGAVALAVGTVLLVVAGIVAIVVGAWQPAAIGVLLFLGVIVVGSVADRLTP
jgi:hypothetical protein